mgnify:CR=1 FL=1
MLAFNIGQTLLRLWNDSGVNAFFVDDGWKSLVMIAIACVFLYLAIRHEFEPLLLVPIAFGMLLVNIYPDIMLHAEDAANGTGGLLYYFYQLDEWSILPSPVSYTHLRAHET